MVTWPGEPALRIEPLKRIARGDSNNVSIVTLGDHTGTHVDAPVHFYDGEFRLPRGKTIAELSLDKLIGEAVLIDASDKDGTEPVSRGLLEARAADQGVEIRRGDIVIVRFWPKAWEVTADAKVFLDKLRRKYAA